MNVTLGVAIYFVLWWVVLFAVLPWGVRSQKEAGEALPEGTDPGAPILPQLAVKAIATTIISAALFAAGFGIWKAGLISLDSLPMPYERLKL